MSNRYQRISRKSIDSERIGRGPRAGRDRERRGGEGAAGRPGRACNGAGQVDEGPQVLERTGGADGIRTHDLLDAIEARSQLRHGPTGRPAATLSL